MSTPINPDAQTNGDLGNYDPGLMYSAIKELEKSMGDITQGGGHVSEFMTAELMYLLQGFGGEQVGQDGQNQTTLTGLQGQAGKIWSEIQADLSGAANVPGAANAWTTLHDELDAMRKKIATLVSEKVISPDLGQQLTSSIDNIIGSSDGKVPGIPDAVKNYWDNNEGKYSKDTQNTINSLIADKNYMAVIYLLSGPLDSPAPQGGAGGRIPGTAQFVDALTSQMTTMNQQLTGASQVMGTIAKSDAKTLQSEQSGYNNFLQMLKKLTSYLVQLQRTN